MVIDYRGLNEKTVCGGGGGAYPCNTLLKFWNSLAVQLISQFLISGLDFIKSRWTPDRERKQHLPPIRAFKVHCNAV